MKKIKISLSILCLGLITASVASAAGFGVSGQPPQATAINQLLTPSNQANPLVQGRENTVPRNMVIAPQNPAYVAQTNVVQTNGGPAPSDSTNESAASQQAFAQTVRNMMPLSPQQIETLHYMFNKSQQAASAYPGTPPRPTSSTVLVNLSPGSTPPTIRLRSGYVTSLVFLDSTGQPWPIVAYDLGDPQAFNVAPNQPDGKINTLLVQALDTYKSGNLAVMLKGENTPIMLTLLPGQRAVDYRVDLRVPGLGPNAQPSLNGVPNTEDPQLVNFLDGVPPNGAKTLLVSGGPCQAWLFGEHIFLRTRLTVLSPSWLSTMSSPDGTHVYQLTKTPVILASQHGTVTQLMIRGL